MNTRKCPVCGNPIAGRTDKKYCSDQCRSIENNKNKINAEAPILEINRVLRKNRSILKTLCPFGQATVRKEILDSMGFDVKVFSTIFLTNKKQLYYFCYDYGFTPLIDKGVARALIVSKQPYMNEWNPWRYVKAKDVGDKN